MTPAERAPLPPATRAQIWCDRFEELSGSYRLRLYLGGVTVAPRAQIKSPSRFRAGRGVVVQAGALVHCGGKSWSQGLGHVLLAEDTVIGPNCVLYGAGGIHIGRYTHLGPGVMLMSQSGLHGPGRLSPTPTHQFAPIHIGEGCWIGAGAVVLGGARLGRCVTVAPNSVVAGDIADNAVVVGNPGRVMLHNDEVKA